MKPPRITKFARSLCAAALLLSSLPATRAQDIKPEAKQEVLAAINKIIENNAYVPGVDFSKWPKLIATYKTDIEKAKTDEQFRDAINSAFEEFGFSHMTLIDPNSAKSRSESANVGIGINIRNTQEGVLVVRVYPSAPAAEANIQPGDVIIEKDGLKVKSATELLGKEGETVNLTVKSPDGKTRKVTITRKRFSNVRPETMTWLNSDTVVLKIPTFDVNYNQERVDDLMAKASGAKNLILDLRDNGGGSVINLMHTLGKFLPDGSPIGSFVDRKSFRRYSEEKGVQSPSVTDVAAWMPQKIKVYGDDTFQGKVSVLVNGGTGSASEIAAAALHDYLGAPIIGSRSAGAVLVAVIAKMPRGYMMEYPVFDFVTEKGVRLEGTGVQPDRAIEDPDYDRPAADDPVVKAAYGELLARIRSAA